MKIKISHIIVLCIILAGSLIFTNTYNFSPDYSIEDLIDKEKIESVLNDKYSKLISISGEILNIAETRPEDTEGFFYDKCGGFFKNEGFGFFLYENNVLRYWTTNDIPVPTSSTFHFFDNQLIYLNNGWYMCYSEQVENIHIVGLFQIKKEYSYENDNLASYYWHGLKLSPQIAMSTDFNNNSKEICFNEDQTCFYLLMPNSLENIVPKFTIQHFLVLFNFILLIVIIILTFIYLVKRFEKFNCILFLLLFIIFVLLRYFMLKLNYFDIFFNMRLFNPELFAESFWLPSLGDYIANVFLFFTFSILFFFYFNVNKEYKKNKTYVKILTSVIIAILMLLITNFISELFYGLVWNSSISFEFDKVLNLSIYSVIATIIIVTVILDFVFIIYRILKRLKENISLGIIMFVLLVGCIINLFLRDINNLSFYSISIFSSLFFLLWTVLSYIALKRKFTYLTYILFLIIISLITSEYFSRLSNKKELDAYRVMTYNLATERDVSAEFFIKQTYSEIQNDPEISRYIYKRNFAGIEKKINSILLSKRYFNKYETQTTICLSTDTLLIEQDMLSVNCFDFFRNQIDEYGIVIPNTNFYFIDNHNGRISYIGEISTRLEDSTFINIYIELNSKIFSEGLGYPELLLDKKLVVKKGSNDYNYAKYVGEHLVTSKGDYKYQFTLKPEDRYTSEYSYYLKDGYVHFRYRPDDDDVLIILSKPNTQFSNELVSFTYVFTILFILFNLFWLIINIINGKIRAGTSLKTKSQISYVAILILSLIITGSISIYFIVQAYKQKQEEILQDKVNSVLVELEQTVGNKAKLDYESAKYLNNLLIDFSNIFYTDINIYDLNGLLLSSSRFELYDKGLKGRYVDNRVYKDLIIDNSGAIIINESIDNVEYLSAYTPFRNYNNEVIAYLNLPYFARQSEFTEEISNFIIAFSNVFLILILITVIAGVIISRQLTMPLVIIRDKIKAMNLEEKTEKIVYTKNDEIGALIKEYNRKVDELSESANKLAQSERELAWREMAKQIAHEIKNPLTPMKLSVQYLERAYNMNDKNWEETFRKVSKTLIEQIDTLSRIASEFSNFAQMPDAQKEDIDLKDIIMNSIQLFSSDENINFELDFDIAKPVIVYADKEQMIRVFNNLIKNGIQAIPKNRNGIIKIKIDKTDNNYIIKVIDNGTGISMNMIPRIFQPNFTTKSGGMGLGLSMVKNMLISNNAFIYFNTKDGIGTEFIIEIPKVV